MRKNFFVSVIIGLCPDAAQRVALREELRAASRPGHVAGLTSKHDPRDDGWIRRSSPRMTRQENAMPAALLNCFALPVRGLAWLGRQGTRAIAALVVIGIALPPLGELLKPYVAEAIFLLLCISFMRVDIAALRDHLRRPGIVIAASAWTMIAVPALIGIGCLAAGVDRSSPDLFLALMLQAVASPMMAAPAMAALMGLDSTLALITLVTGTALVPLTAPLFAWIFFGSALTLSPLALGVKLALMLAGSLGVAMTIRKLFGISAIRRAREPIDG